MAFAKFPNFTKLTLADKAEYEELIKDYPPIADISFAGVMGWWGLHSAPRVATLNGNLVIHYFLAEDSKNSGLSLIGIHDIDGSICTIFDYLRAQGEPMKLVHVPEFVINNMDYPDLYNFDAERDLDEYIIPISKFFPLENLPSSQRRRVVRFLDSAQGRQVRVGRLDLSQAENQELLLDCIETWPRKSLNNMSAREHIAMMTAVKQADRLGLENVCVIIDGRVHSFVLFQAPHNKKYITIEYAMVSYALPYILNFTAHIVGEWFIRQGVEYANLCMDYGKPSLRIIKLALGPINFFRKYTIEPSKESRTIKTLIG